MAQGAWRKEHGARREEQRAWRKAWVRSPKDKAFWLRKYFNVFFIFSY
jgi:hypothetical protein